MTTPTQLHRPARSSKQLAKQLAKPVVTAPASTTSLPQKSSVASSKVECGPTAGFNAAVAAANAAVKSGKSIPRMDAGSNPFGDLVSPYSQHGLFIMLYGPPGEGKTTVAAQMDKPLFVATAGEQGIHIHKKHKRVDPTIPVIDLPQLFDADCIPANSGHPGWEKAIEVLDRFGSTKHDRKTLVFDSVSGLEQISYQHCASRLFDGKITDPEFTSFARGATMAANVYWQTEFLPRCLELAAKGFNVVLIAHSSFKNTRNPIGPDFDKYRPELGKTVFEVLNKSLQGLFYLGRDVSVMVNQATKKKIVTSDRRFIGLMPSTYYEAKSWLSSSSEGEVECGDTAAETWANLRVVIGA